MARNVIVLTDHAHANQVAPALVRLGSVNAKTTLAIAQVGVAKKVSANASIIRPFH